MTQDEIIEMARQAGINYRELSDEFATGNGDGVEIEQMQAFAKLVRDDYSFTHAQLWLKRIDEVVKAEREACAKIAQKTVCDTHIPTGVKIYGTAAAKAIRQRGEQHE